MPFALAIVSTRTMPPKNNARRPHNCATVSGNSGTHCEFDG
jgi:hypothetical protein